MRTRPRRYFLAVFLLPGLALYSLFVAYPAVRALLYSLQKWDGFNAPEWVGLGNFRELLFEDDLFFAALSHNLILLVGAGSGIMILSLTFAALLHRRVRGAALFRVTFFFPNVIAAVAIALLWTLLYSVTEFGVVNAVLAGFNDFSGLESAAAAVGLPWPLFQTPIEFLDSSNLIFALIPMIVWALTGFYMVLFLAAMSGIPETYYEAARLDGATGLQQFRHITLPLIREVISVGAIFLLISMLKFFDPVWVMESEFPTADSHVLATLVYQKVFSEYDIGKGAAVAVLLFLFVFAATMVSLRLSRAERIEY